MATVLAVGLMGLLVTVALVATAAVGLVDCHRRAQSAADLAALAGGGALADGRDPCSAAADIASRNGARLTGCRIGGATVAVHVTVPPPAVLAAVGELRARARAGPASVPGLAPSLPPATSPGAR